MTEPPQPSASPGLDLEFSQALKSEYTKRLLRATGARPAQRLPRRDTPHYREGLRYTTYVTDPHMFFAPITSATGKLELSLFSEHGKCDLDQVTAWTTRRRPPRPRTNAARAPGGSHEM
jgi:hypothetical protein